MNKALTCSMSTQCVRFYRKMVVQGESIETRDEFDQPMDVENPETLTLVKRLTGVWCAVHHQAANVRLPF